MTKKKPASSSATRWMKFYPRDWIGDSELRTCSLAARGLWIDMLCLMDSASPRGHLKLGRKRIDPPTLAGLTNTPVGKVEKLLGELRKKGVFSVTTHGTIYCRKMVAERKRSANGAKLAAIRWTKETEYKGEIPLRNAGGMTPESRNQNKQESCNSRLVAGRAKRHQQPAKEPPDFSKDPVHISEALSRTRIVRH